MNRDFLQKKINELTDDKIIDLLHQSRPSTDIFELATQEATRRGIEFKYVDKAVAAEEKADDNNQLKNWNWGAFLLAPLWALTHKLEIWAILWFVPIVNIGVIFYLGYHGNRLAFEMSNISSVDDFMMVQRDWGVWAIRFFWLGLLGGLVSLFLNR